MLNISPFSYGLQVKILCNSDMLVKLEIYCTFRIKNNNVRIYSQVQMVYDSGTIFEPKILDIKPEDLRARFMAGVRNVAAVSLEIGYPTVASVPHSLINGFKNLLAVAAVTEVTFKEAETVKEFIKVRLTIRVDEDITSNTERLRNVNTFDHLFLGSQQVCSCCCRSCPSSRWLPS